MSYTTSHSTLGWGYSDFSIRRCSQIHWDNLRKHQQYCFEVKRSKITIVWKKFRRVAQQTRFGDRYQSNFTEYCDCWISFENRSYSGQYKRSHQFLSKSIFFKGTLISSYALRRFNIILQKKINMTNILLKNSSYYSRERMSEKF